MSSAGINFGGLASGLDTKAIISALMAVERRPIAALQGKKKSFDTQKRLLGDFKGLLASLQKAAEKVGNTRDFLRMSATSNHEDLLTVTAGNTATPGTHQVVVRSLARAQLNISSGYADKNAASFGTGTLLLNVGGTDYGIEIGTGGNSSLQGVADAINAQADAQNIGVAAEVVDTGATGSNRYKLVMRSTQVGASGAFSLVLDNGNAALTTLVTQLNSGATAAANAQFDVNGVTLTRSSNSVSDAIAGVTLDLHAFDATKTVTVTITTDAEETSKSVKEFVDAYNKVVDFVAGQNTVATGEAPSSPLFGDGTLRTIRSTLRQIVGSTVATDNVAMTMLVQVGITSDREGRLTFNQSRFEEQLGSDEQAMTALFGGSGVGIAARIDAQIDLYTSSADGLLKTRTDGFDRLIRDTQRRIDQGEERLVRFEESLERRFANLEGLLARLQGQGSALASFPTRQNN